jgi:putative CocE/NonD family hydrolase
MNELHRQWYEWTMRGGLKPFFLRKNVAYYVMGTERWRYADSLDEVTGTLLPLYLDSNGTAHQIFASGRLRAEVGHGPEDTYVYDPRDVTIAAVESAAIEPLSMRPIFPVDELTDQRAIFAREGKQLVYHGEPFDEDIEISGFFRLVAWLAIDQPDTDFIVAIYELDASGGSMLLTSDTMRARFRGGLREEKLIHTTDPLRYEFERFTFVSRLLRKGSRLRLVIGSVCSIFHQRNYNSGGSVSEESINEARVVTVRLFHDKRYPSVLIAPLGKIAD